MSACCWWTMSHLNFSIHLIWLQSEFSYKISFSCRPLLVAIKCSHHTRNEILVRATKTAFLSSFFNFFLFFLLLHHQFFALFFFHLQVRTLATCNQNNDLKKKHVFHLTNGCSQKIVHIEFRLFNCLLINNSDFKFKVVATYLIQHPVLLNDSVDIYFYIFFAICFCVAYALVFSIQLFVTSLIFRTLNMCSYRNNHNNQTRGSISE